MTRYSRWKPDTTPPPDDRVKPEIVMERGVLTIAWTPGGRVLMTGPVATSFVGTLDLARFA